MLFVKNLSYGTQICHCDVVALGQQNAQRTKQHLLIEAVVTASRGNEGDNSQDSEKLDAVKEAYSPKYPELK